MIESLSGIVRNKTSESAIIDCNGVGYGVAMPISSLAKLGSEGSKAHILVYTHLSQDALRLFGFVDTLDRQTFAKLVTTRGVGPKLALAILSVFSADELAHVVEQGDKTALVKIPGVGSKKADRLLLELKDRLDPASNASSAGAPTVTGSLEDLVSALTNLGFKDRDADSLARQAKKDNPQELNVAILAREALRLSTCR